MIRSNPSRIALWLAGCLLLVGLLVNPRWKREQIIKGDVIQYYSYLPAAFIHQDMAMRYAANNAYYANKMWGKPLPNGGFLQKYTCGHALMLAPFFIVGHITANVLDYPLDGYSVPYQFAVALASATYVFLGLLLTRKILIRHFSEAITGLTLLCIFVGTHLLYYASVDAGMPHAELFFLVALFAWLTLRFHENPSAMNALLLGFAGGLAFLARPPHLLLWLLPLGYGVTNQGTWKEKLHFLRQAGWRLALLPVGSILLLLLQMAYWKIATGNWIEYSYGDEHFFWNQPLVGQVLFSFRKGWLIYTPMMALALIGFVWLRRYTCAWGPSIGLLMVTSIIVISSWWCWWYGGSLGMRPMIDYYALLALPLAAFLQRMTERRRARIATLSIVFLFIGMNLFQTVQYLRGILHHDAMTPRAWVHMWHTTDREDPAYKASLAPPDVEGAKKGDRNFW